MLHFGIIGMGVRGKLFLETIRQNPLAQVAAVCDSNPETIAAVEAQYRVKGYQDFRKMMDEEVLDAVIVATPDFLHRDPVVYAAQKGIHLLVEKPFSTDELECAEMCKAIEENHVKCMVAFENRWNLPIAAVKEQITGGQVGDILNINARLNNRISSPTKNLKWARNSSVGWFLFPHILDMVLWFNGNKPVKQVYAVGTKKKLVSMGYDIYDSLQATISFEDGTNATLTSSWVLPETLALGYDLKLEIIGSQEAIYVNTYDQCVQQYTSTSINNVHSLSTPIDGRLTACPCYMVHHFIDCLHRDVQPESNAAMGALNTKIICAIHRSADEGGRVITL